MQGEVERSEYSRAEETAKNSVMELRRTESEGMRGKGSGGRRGTPEEEGHEDEEDRKQETERRGDSGGGKTSPEQSSASAMPVFWNAPKTRDNRRFPGTAEKTLHGQSLVSVSVEGT